MTARIGVRGGFFMREGGGVKSFNHWWIDLEVLNKSRGMDERDIKVL